MKKYDNARKVTFNEDFMGNTREVKGEKKQDIIFKKGEVVCMEVSVAERLEERGANVTIEMFDFKKIENQKRKELQEAKKQAA